MSRSIRVTHSAAVPHRDAFSHVAHTHAQARAHGTPSEVRHCAALRHSDHRDALDRLAQAVRNLSPCRHDPERFHVEKDAISAELRRLALEISR